MVKKIFVNLPVKDLLLSTAFFEHLGFKFNPQFTNDNGACMVIGENIYAMLLIEKFFASFHLKDIADTTRVSEVILAIDAESRGEVDHMLAQVIQSGGAETRETQDHGWMYSRSFQDLDGHLWEVMYMDESAIPQQPHVQ